MSLWSRNRRDTAIEVASVRLDLLARVANLESKLSRAESEVSDCKVTATTLMMRDKTVTKLKTDLTEMQLGMQALQAFVGERIEAMSASLQSAHRANGGRAGGRGRGREATQIGEEVLAAMATPDGIRGLIRQLEQQLHAAPNGAAGNDASAV